MDATNFYKYCKNCYVKLEKPTKKSYKHIVLSNYKESCANCKNVNKLVIGFDNEKE